MVKIDRIERKLLISFNASKVAPKHTLWLQQVEQRVGLGELDPQPYWGFDDLAHKAGTKLLNCFYVQAAVKINNAKEYYNYQKVFMLEKFKFGGLLKAIETAHMLIDFDARTGHNHGTKFRLRQNYLPALYERVTVIVDSSELPDQLKLAA